MSNQPANDAKPLQNTSGLTDTATLRANARQSIEDGAITKSYSADREAVIKLLWRRFLVGQVVQLREHLQFGDQLLDQLFELRELLQGLRIALARALVGIERARSGGINGHRHGRLPVRTARRLSEHSRRVPAGAGPRLRSGCRGCET